MSDLQPAKIIKFSEQQGFGTVELNDGTQYSFDYSACAGFQPEEGSAVAVELGPSRLGGLKVVRVEQGDD